MPRLIDLQCPECAFTEEVEKTMSFFEDEFPEENPCPRCGYTYRQELPPAVTLHLKPEKDYVLTPQRPKKLLPDTILPDDIRRAFAKELFDPCSCGGHAPADIDEHAPDCHVNNHSFMQSKRDSVEQQHTHEIEK